MSLHRSVWWSNKYNGNYRWQNKVGWKNKSNVIFKKNPSLLFGEKWETVSTEHEKQSDTTSCGVIVIIFWREVVNFKCPPSQLLTKVDIVSIEHSRTEIRDEILSKSSKIYLKKIMYVAVILNRIVWWVLLHLRQISMPEKIKWTKRCLVQLRFV